MLVDQLGLGGVQLDRALERGPCLHGQEDRRTSRRSSTGRAGSRSDRTTAGGRCRPARRERSAGSAPPGTWMIERVRGQPPRIVFSLIPIVMKPRNASPVRMNSARRQSTLRGVMRSVEGRVVMRRVSVGTAPSRKPNGRVRSDSGANERGRACAACAPPASACAPSWVPSIPSARSRTCGSSRFPCRMCARWPRASLPDRSAMPPSSSDGDDRR